MLVFNATHKQTNERTHRLEKIKYIKDNTVAMGMEYSGIRTQTVRPLYLSFCFTDGLHAPSYMHTKDFYYNEQEQ